MADLSKFESAPKLQLLTELKGARCVMLGSPASGEHMQPMAPQIDKETLKSVKNGGESVFTSTPTIRLTSVSPRSKTRAHA